MRYADVVDYCLAKPGAFADNPFGEDHWVAKVGGKIFCFYGSADGPLGIAVKNTREVVQEWRDRFPEHVGVGRYLHKQLWNQVDLATSGGPDIDDVHELIDDSYRLVVESLPKAKRP